MLKAIVIKMQNDDSTMETDKRIELEVYSKPIHLRQIDFE